MSQDSNYTFVKALRAVFITTMLLLTAVTVMAEDDTPKGVVVKGNVFGGGNQADVQVNTTVEISTGKVEGNVYGGGNVGDVGTMVKRTDYNYKWTNANPSSIDLDDSSTFPWNETGVCTVNITGGTIGTGVTANVDGTYANGNVFGAGKGLEDTWWCEKAIAYKSNVTVTDGKIKGTVYGGGQVGRVETDAVVTIGTANETGTESKPTIAGNVFGAGAGVKTHGYSALVRGNSTVTVQGIAQVGKSVYGGGEIASVGKFTVVGGLPKHPDSGGTCTVTIQDNAKIGANGAGHNVFGACKGVTPAFDSSDLTKNRSFQTESNRPKYANGQVKEENTYWNYVTTYPEGYEGTKFVWVYYRTEPEYLDFLETLALTSHPIVTIAEDATVNGSVFGGGERGITLGSVEVNMNGGTVTQDFYGGGALANTNKGNWDDSQYVLVTGLTAGISSVTGLYTRSGAGTDASPYTYTEATGLAEENTDYYSKGNWASGKYTYNSEKKIYETTYKTNVTLTGGTIKGNVYGGGLGQIGRAGEDAVGTEGEDGYKPAVTAIQEVKAKVFGDVLVTLNRTKTAVKTGEGAEATTTYTYASDGTCVVQGDIFGCNNQNGSPQSAVTVHIFRTQGWDGHNVTEGKNDATKEKTGTTYELSAVYGGGNLSAFYPDLKATRDTIQTHVIIDGCALTSIEQVYGGGNAASTPATNLTINSVYEIGEVFGGGNGLKDITVNGVTQKNPGANVGYTAYHTDYDPPASSATERTTKFSYGSGKASVNIYGGTIHYVFGGSNTKGNVRQTAITLLDNQDPCVLDIDEAYGGGRSAPMDAEAKLLMACIPGLKAAYGGAQAADVQNNVVLNITNGTFDRVFGGNNLSGTISGSITVNIEETGCVPLIIGELYGGGNQAPYSVYGYDEDGNPIEHDATKKYADPQINVKSFTSIGNIYGGGYGTGAVMYGDPTVNINVTEGKYKEYVGVTSLYGDDYDYDANGYKGNPNKMIDGHKVVIPPHKAGSIGAIQNVFGGGNAAAVVGSTRVNVGTTSKEYVTVPDNDIEVGVTDVSTLFTRTGEGTSVSPFVYTVVGTSGSGAGKAEEGVTYYKECAVKGADIKGNVYGGGNQAKVSGSTNVTIGKETTTTP